MTNTRSQIIRAAMLTLGIAMLHGPQVQAQDRARDLDPATALERKQQRAAAGPIAFRGASGYFDYVQPITALPDVARSVLPALFTLRDDGFEPIDALRQYQTRGHRVDINWDHLDRLQPGQQHRMRLPLFDGEEIELVFLRCEWRGPARWTWFGQIAGIAASHFVLVRHEDAVDLVINNYNDRRQYEMHIVPALGERPVGHALRKVGDIPPSDAKTYCATCSDKDCAAVPADPAGAPPFMGKSFPPVADPTTVLDVLFVCSMQARSGYGNSPNAFAASAEQCISQTNVRLSNSGVNLSLRLMSADWDLAGSYSENTNGHIDLYNLADSFAPTNAAAFTATRAAGVDRCADLVALIRESEWPGGTGVAFVAQNNTQLTENGAAQYSVNARNGWISLTTDIFPHEAGHNIGACHEAGNGNCTVAFPAPKGKRFNCCGNFCWDAWHTVMAYYHNDCCLSPFTTLSSPVPFYSNPNISYSSGICNPAMGDSESYVASLIQTNRALITQRRIAATQRWVNVLGGGFNDPTSGGRYHYAHSRVAVGVANVQGGTSDGIVRVRGYGQANAYNETAANGGQPVTLSNPCKIVKWGVPGEPEIVLK